MIFINEMISVPVNELGIFGAILVLVAIFYKLISAVQIVIDIFKAMISEQMLPAMIAIVSVAVTAGISGSNYIFISNNQYHILQDGLILPIVHIFAIELVIVFLISKRPKMKKFTIFVGVLLISALVFQNNYNQVYILMSLFVFTVSVIRYRRLDSVNQKQYYGALYLKIILATSFVLCTVIFLNVVLNIGTIRTTNALLVIAVVALIEYEFHTRIMEEIRYL